ncbi:MAG TPA: hypothetical protein VMB52_04845 [Verrucomicrobiae bacterium]|nr:hypothetical protein [Verrucomicrobiae bacterium]
MSISVVQTTTSSTNSTTFSNPVTAGNTVFVFPLAYTLSAPPSVTSSAPTLGGSTLSGTVEVSVDIEYGSVSTYSAIWMIPNVTGGETVVSIAVQNAGGVIGCLAVEVTGLGPSPSLDAHTFGIAGATGTTGMTTAADQLVLLAVGQTYSPPATPGSPWTTFPSPQDDFAFAYQISGSTGETFQYTDSGGNGNDGWCGAIVTIKPTPWSVLQSHATEGFSGSSIASTYQNNLSSGSVLLAFITGYLMGISSITDGNGHTFTQVGFASDQGEGGGTQVSLWALSTPNNIVGTRPTITATVGGSGSGGPYGAMMIQEVSGISAVPDGTAGTAGYFNATGTVGPPSYTSSAAGEYLFYGYGEDGYNVTLTGPTGYTVDGSSIMTNAPDANIAIAYKSSTNGTETGQWSTSSGDGLALLMVAFKLTGTTTSPPGLFMTGYM